MAHFAKLGINSKVISVEVVADKDCKNADGIEDEEVGRQFLERIHNWPLWKQTSYNTLNNKHNSGDNSKAFRGNYAGIGYTYDEDNDIFIHPKPYASWVLNVAEAKWESPVGPSPELTDEQKAQNNSGTPDTPPTHAWSYKWNESGQSWDLVDDLA